MIFPDHQERLIRIHIKIDIASVTVGRLVTTKIYHSMSFISKNAVPLEMPERRAIRLEANNSKKPVETVVRVNIAYEFNDPVNIAKVGIKLLLYCRHHRLPALV